MKDRPYAWRVGDVFTDGTYRWAVDSVHGEKAVLRSCGSSWATTSPLTFIEWREGGRWRLEAQEKLGGAATSAPAVSVEGDIRQVGLNTSLGPIEPRVVKAELEI